MLTDYEISDFTEATYQELPRYQNCLGIEVSRIRALHNAHPGFESEGTLGEFSLGHPYIWFMHRKEPCHFDIYAYDVVTWGENGSPVSAEPAVHVTGTTFDGVRATWFSNTEPSNLTLLGKALIEIDAEIARRGWSLD